jgi:predicted nucleic acid-binding Zn ribbon protein
VTGAGGDGPPGPRRGTGSSRPARALETRSARDAIKALLRFHGIDDEIRARRVLTEWSDLVGPRIAERTRPWGVNERTLVIEVASSAWLHELNMLRPQILMGLLERLGDPRLFDDIKFRLAGGPGRGPQRSEMPRPRRLAEPARPMQKPATGIIRERIAREVESVDDLELRELIARVRIDNDR